MPTPWQSEPEPEPHDTLGFVVLPEHGRARETFRKRMSSLSSTHSSDGLTLSPKRAGVLGVALHTEAQFERVELIRSCAWAGITARLRPAVWLHATGGFALKEASTRPYTALCEEAAAALTRSEKDQIMIDVPRTFSHCHPLFAEDTKESVLPQLERVLQTATCQCGSVYWQGYNFIAGMLLLVCDSEEDAFWCFLAMLRTMLSGIFGSGGPNVEVLMLDELMRQYHPKMIKQIVKIGVPLQTFTTPWLICMFATSLPPETVLRIWDLLILSAAQSEHLFSLAQISKMKRTVSAGVVAISGISAGGDPQITTDVTDRNDDQDPPPTASVVTSDVLLLTSLAVLQLVHKEAEHISSPDKLNAIFKARPRELYDVEALFTAALEIAYNDRCVWHSGWPLRAELNVVRIRSRKILSIQNARSKRYNQVQSAFLSAAGEGMKNRLQMDDLVEFFRGMYKQRQAGGQTDLTMEKARASADGPHPPDDLESKIPWLEKMTDAMWTPLANAFFAMVDDQSKGYITRAQFVTFAKAMPHITQSFGSGSAERARYRSHRLKRIFNKFDQKQRGYLQHEEVLNMFRMIHTAAARLLKMPWAEQTSPAAKANFTQADWAADYARFKSWEDQTVLLLQSIGVDVLSFDEFERCTVSHPTIAIGLCLLRREDIEQYPGTKGRLDLVSESKDRHLTQILINVEDRSASPSVHLSDSSTGISRSFLGRQQSFEMAHYIATVVQARYVPSTSIMENFTACGHIEYKVQVVTEDDIFVNPSCTHDDFIRLRDNIVDEYPRETRLSEAHRKRILAFRLPEQRLTRFSQQAVLDRKNLWKSFLDTLQSCDEDEARVQVCLADLVKIK